MKLSSVLSLIAGLACSASAFATLADEAAKPAAPKAAAMKPAPNLLTEPTLYVVGYAHLDTQWRWTYADSIREFLPKTLNDNFNLFEKYPSYVFNFSGSRRYQMMKEYYPEQYAKMKQYITAGRWFPCGSSVDENDANVPSAESFVRQVLYGNKYFRQEFGLASEEFMLPDCFGFPASMPTMLAHCGLKGFSTQKLTWNAVVPIPFKVGMWEGTDGTRIAAALDPGSYTGEVKENLANSASWKTRLENHRKESGILADYHYFGTGDTGGAPTEKSVAMVETSVNTKGDINVVSGNADAMFNALTPEMQKRLPTYKGELMLTEHSAGSVTSQAYMKRWNRKNELLADAAERASLAAWWLGGRPYPSTKIEDAWYLVLGSQMHDILPGTSVPKAYEYSWNDEILAANMFCEVLTDATSAVVSALDTRATGSAIVVYNALSFDRQDVVEASVPAVGAMAAAKGIKVTGPDGKPVAAQILSISDGVARIAFVAMTPSVSYSTFDVELQAAAGPVASTLKVTENTLENGNYLAKIDANGDVSSIFDKLAKKELLSAPIRLGLHYENPREWPAWNQDWADRKLPPKAFAGGPVTMKIAEDGPARVAIEVTRSAEGSTFIQRVRLCAGDAGSRVEFDTDIDWRSRQRSLRVHFPLAVSNPKATYDLAAGAIERGNGQEKQFEYSFHHWFDLTDSKKDYGVTAISDSKYGADKPTDNTVRLTLLHTPGTRGGYPDQGTQDIGRHHVLYALYGHAGDWKQAQGPAQGARLNQPLMSFASEKHEGPLGKSYSLMNVSDKNVSISAAKKAEEGDEIIIRLREHTGNAAKGVQVALAQPIVSAREVDGQERPIGAATVTGGKLVTDVRGYGLRAFAVKVGKPATQIATLQSKPIALAFDADVISSTAKPNDGAMDSEGRSYPGSMIPATLVAEGVTFNFGPTANGQKNAVACNGQEIKIPEGGFNRLYVLASATGDTAANIMVDGKPVPWSVQSWNGYIGQWDNRIWPTTITESYGGNGEIIGLTPGFIKDDTVAWFSSHYNTSAGNSFYEFCYIYKYGIELPAGAKVVTLPKDSKIKVFAATAANTGGSRVTAARPLFDTLSGHQQDAPQIVPAAGKFSDATEIRVEPAMYWRPGSIRFTTDGSEPTAKSPVYSGPVTLAAAATVKASVLGADGSMSPIAASKFEVNDTTAPSIQKVEAVYQAPTLRLEFSEALGASAATAANYAIEPAIAVTKAELQADQRSVLLTLAEAPEMKQSYKVIVTGVADASPAANAMKASTAEFAAAGPVYSLAAMSPEQRGTTIRDIAGLPVKGTDKWSMNMFVKMDKQPPNRTVIAGFGKCADGVNGQARYLVKFAPGIHFWSSNRDVGTTTQYDLNRWQMITITYDGTTVRTYKDGKKIAEGVQSFADDENSISLAPKDPWEKMRTFDGEIRDLTIWSVPLGQEAIATLSKSAPK